MATTTKKTTTKTKKASITADAEITEPKKSKELQLVVSPAEPQVNYQFTVEIHELEPGTVAELAMTRPGGAVSASAVSSSPDGTAQFLTMASEVGDHELHVTAGDKKGKATITVGP
jgi:hypothetical protein